jgi:signal transduction histidine kinase
MTSSGLFADERLRRLLETARALVSELEPDAVLDELLTAAREFTGAHYAAIGVLDPTRSRLERFITQGLNAEQERALGSPPRGRGILGVLIDEPSPLRLDRVGEHPRSYGFPPGHPPMASFLGVPIVIGGRPWGNLYLTDKDGADSFTDEDEEAVVLLAEWAAIAVHNARTFERSEEQRAALSSAVAALEATTDIALAVGGETELERVLELIAKRGRALVEARLLVIALGEGDALEVTMGAGELPDGLVGGRLPLRDAPLRQLLDRGRPVRLDEVDADLRWWRAAVVSEGVRSALLVPLVFRGRPVGVLAAFDHLGRQVVFSADDERLLTAFAASAATAVAGAQSVAAERLRAALAAAERERRRWARELHDETLQHLAALSITLTSALRSGDDAALRRALEGAVTQAQHQVRELRGLITELRPADLDDLGLAAALGALAERTHETSELRVVVDTDVCDRLDPELEAGVYRLVQEALTNAVKHSSGSRVDVRVRTTDHDVEVEVRDDGIGFDTAAANGGFGLVGMRERAELAGGSLTVQRADPGTRISAHLPLLRSSPQPLADLPGGPVQTADLVS